MNSERISEQPSDGAASASPQRGISHDQVAYRGPLLDPAMLPVEEGVRPPDHVRHAAPEDRWKLSEEELSPEHVRHLGRYLYVSMFYDRSPVVTKELYRAYDEAKAQGEAGWVSEVAPIHWPAEVFVEHFANYSGLSMAMLHRFCDAASRDIAQQMLQILNTRRSALHKHGGDVTRAEQIAADIAMIEHIAQDGLQGTINEHTTMLRTAGTYYVELGVSPPLSTTAR